MSLTLVPLPTVYAGPDASQCGTNGYSITGSTATLYSSILWTTSGTGTFSDPGALHPVYFPGVADVTAGSVTLTITAYGNGICSATGVPDLMILYLSPEVTANAGNPASVCENSTYMINDATAANFNTLTLEHQRFRNIY